MSSLPFTDQQCFFVVIFAFAIGGFIRGWRRECISLIFILLAAVLIHPSTNQMFGQFLSRLPSTLSFLLTGKSSAASAASTGATPNFGPFWALLIFLLLAALGYYIGNRAFPKPTTQPERFIGIIPALIAGSTVLYYINTGGFFARTADGQTTFSTVFMLPDPAQYVPIMFVIAIIAAVIALISSRTKKAPPPAAKK